MDLEEAVRYVGAAYAVVLAVVLVYVLLIGSKVGRLERELDRVEAELDARDAGAAEGARPTPERVA